MRDIKFRVWHIEDERMIESAQGVYTCLKDVLNVSTGSGFSDCDTSAKSGRYEIMQYTGLKDKNGVEIYEGDIVKFYEGRRIDFADVRYSDIYGYWFANNCEGARFHSCEVIGNICQNPDLLGAAQ